MIHFYILNQYKPNTIGYYRDSDSLGNTFMSENIFKQFSFTSGGQPWPKFFKNHQGYTLLMSAPEDFTPLQFAQTYPEFFI